MPVYIDGVILNDQGADGHSAMRMDRDAGPQPNGLCSLTHYSELWADSTQRHVRISTRFSLGTRVSTYLTHSRWLCCFLYLQTCSARRRPSTPCPWARLAHSLVLSLRSPLLPHRHPPTHPLDLPLTHPPTNSLARSLAPSQWGNALRIWIN